MASLLVGVTTGLRLGLRGGGLARKEGRMDGGEKVKSSLMFAWGWVLLSRDQLRWRHRGRHRDGLVMVSRGTGEKNRHRDSRQGRIDSPGEKCKRRAMSSVWNGKPIVSRNSLPLRQPSGLLVLGSTEQYSV